MKKTTVLMGALALMWAAAAMAADGGNDKLTLIREGKPEAAIVLPDKPTLAAQWGAHELQWHLRQMTGAELPILPESQAVTGPAVKLWVGDTARARALGLIADKFKPGEHVYQILADAVVFAGIDQEDYRALTYDPEHLKLTPFPTQFEARGSADAVYDFLEREAGVRWLAATKTGTVIPIQKTFSVTVGLHRFIPSFAMRDAGRALWGADNEACMWPNQSANTAAYRELCWTGAGKDGGLWRQLLALYCQRRRAGGQPMQGNHSLYAYYYRFVEKHWTGQLAKAQTEKERAAVLSAKTRDFAGDRPEFFAQGYPEQPIAPQLCYTSPALVAQVAQDARDYYDGKKVVGYPWLLPNPFVIEPMDNKSYCRCANCTRWYTPERGAGEYSSGEHSDYMFQFVEAVVKELHKTHPGKEVICLAYMSHSLPPTRFSLDPKVHVQLTLPSNRGAFMTSSYQKEIDNLRVWSEEARRSGRTLSLWLYNTFPREGANNANIQCFPGFFARQFARELRTIHELNYRGIVNCGLGQEVENHVGLALMYDVNADVERLISEYFSGLYGAAAVPMKQLYQEMEAVYADPQNRPAKTVGLAELSWKWLGTPERMQRWQGLMDQARSLAANDRERSNLELFQQSIWNYMKTGADTFTSRMTAPIPALQVKRMADAGGDPLKVAWDKVPAAASPWYRANSDQPARRQFVLRLAHDGRFLYLQFQDPCETAKLGDHHPWETLEWFTANQRGLPFRHFIFYMNGGLHAFLQGEVNWRMDVPFLDAQVRYVPQRSAPDRLTLNVALPFASVVPGGLKPGGMFYLNLVRITSMGLSHPEDKMSLGSLDTLVAFCGLKEMDRLAEVTLEK